MGHALLFRAWPVSFEPGFFLEFRVFPALRPFTRQADALCLWSGGVKFGIGVNCLFNTIFSVCAHAKRYIM
jgi:hypothetical protein